MQTFVLQIMEETEVEVTVIQQILLTGHMGQVISGEDSKMCIKRPAQNPTFAVLECLRDYEQKVEDHDILIIIHISSHAAIIPNTWSP